MKKLLVLFALAFTGCANEFYEVCPGSAVLEYEGGCGEVFFYTKEAEVIIWPGNAVRLGDTQAVGKCSKIADGTYRTTSENGSSCEFRILNGKKLSSD